MDINSIAFPNLGIFLENVPKNFKIGSFTIAYYGCLIALGILLGLLMASYDRKSRGMTDDALWDCAVWGVIFSIVGARAYYVIFAWDFYKNDLLSIFNLRQGGIAIYGAIIGAFVSVFVICKRHNTPFLELFDSLALGFPVGQAIGRWGNFFNREVFGGWSEGLFAMKLPIAAVRQSDISAGIQAHLTPEMDYILVHPTFLYECAWSLMTLAILFAYRKRKKFSGEVFYLYLIFYGVGRFIIEGIRTDQLKTPIIGVPISQIVAVVCIVVASALIVYNRMRLKKNGAALTEGTDTSTSATAAETGGVTVSEVATGANDKEVPSNNVEEAENTESEKKTES